MSDAPSLLRWKEPVAFRRAWKRKFGPPPNRWMPLLIMSGIIAVSLAGALFHNKPMGGSWPLTVALMVAVAAMVAYGVPWIAERDPHLIAISDRGVGRRFNSGGNATFENWTWDEISQCRLEIVTLRQRDHTVFIITTHNGEEAFFALDDEPGRADEISEAVRANGKEIFRAAGPAISGDDG